MHYKDNPAEFVEKTFRRIYDERMKGLPMVNENLQVEALEFRRWNDHWLGAVITPWFLNILLLPGGGRWREYREEGGQEWEFPSGTFTFRGNREEGIGEFQSHVVLSSVLHLENQDRARTVALAAIESLFKVIEPVSYRPEGTGETADTPESDDGKPTSRMPSLITRRSFLRGRMFRE